MSDKAMKIILSILTLILLVLIIGLLAFKGNAPKADLNKIALRVGELRQYRTMNRADISGAMEKAFARIGYSVVSSTEDNLYPSNAEDAGVNFYVRGYNPFNEFRPNKKAVNILYIRDFDSLYPEELDKFDGIATSSRDFYNYVIGAGYAAVMLPEFSDPSVFYPAPREDLVRDLLYVGDNDRHSQAIAAALEVELPVEIYGRFWADNIEDKYIKGEYIHENDLGAYFSSAKINLVNVSAHEAEIGIIPSRIYDVASAKGFIIAPYNKEIEAVFGDSIPMFKDAKELKALYDQYINNPEARAEKAEKAYRIAVSEYNVDAFTQRLNGLVEFLINDKKLEMKLKTRHRLLVFLGLLATAVVLCTLPFAMVAKEKIYVYTETQQLNSRERGFIQELRKNGFHVVLNSKSEQNPQSYSIWINNSSAVAMAEKSQSVFNFIYTEAYYPIEWKNIKKPIIVLTPYQEIYEHYMRSNIQSAQMYLGVDLSIFYPMEKQKKYSFLYYSANNKISPVAEYLKTKKQSWFMGAFWKDQTPNILPYGKAKQRNRILNESSSVIIYNEHNAPESKTVPIELMEATAAGTMVFSSFNSVVNEVYGNQIVFYESLEDFQQKADYYRNHPQKVKEMQIAAQKITAEKLSSKASAIRFIEILNWLKENMKN